MTITTERLCDLAERASGELAEATAEEALQWTVNTFGSDFIVAANMQDAVLIDLATKAKPDIDVLFLETGYHFAETIGTRDAVAQVYPEITVVNAEAEQTVPQQDVEYGPRLHDRDPSLCCHLRKVLPLRNTLANYSWGHRRAQGGRADQSEHADRDLGRAQRSRQGEPDRGVDRRGVQRLHPPARHPAEPARRRRLSLHRLRALHGQGRPRRRPAQRALGRPEQDRMRPARLDIQLERVDVP